MVAITTGLLNPILASYDFGVKFDEQQYFSQQIRINNLHIDPSLSQLQHPLLQLSKHKTQHKNEWVCTSYLQSLSMFENILKLEKLHSKRKKGGHS